MRVLRSCLVFLGLLCAADVPAATFSVNSTVDAPDDTPGDASCQSAAGCTLRAAIMEANALEGPDVILVPAGTYHLTLPGINGWELDPSAGDLEITDNLSIFGDSPDTTTIDASLLGDRIATLVKNLDSYQPFDVEIAGLTLTGGSTVHSGGCLLDLGVGKTTIRNSVITGCTSEQSSGGGISHDGAWEHPGLFVIDSVIFENAAPFGAGIDSQGNLHVIRSSIVGNTASAWWPNGPGSGGGLSSPFGSVSITDSVIANNEAGRQGGGIWALGSHLHLERTSVTGNQVHNATGSDYYDEGVGGGIYLNHALLSMNNSTISGNTAFRRGGGIHAYAGGRLHVAFSTIADNRAGGDWDGAGVTFTGAEAGAPLEPPSFKATLIVGNLAGDTESNCRIFPYDSRSLGYNIVGDNTCGLSDVTDREFTDPGIAPLADNGGFGPTHALLPESPAIDLVPVAECFAEIDNDWDGKLDEDPVNGIDDDGDVPVDEDPVDVVDVDQRGWPRPAGDRCDGGAFEVVEEPEVLIEKLITDVETIIEAGELNYGRGRSLIAELQVALWFLEFNNGERIAVTRIELFIIKVERLIAKGDLDPELGNELLMQARIILELLQRS